MTSVEQKAEILYDSQVIICKNPLIGTAYCTLHYLCLTTDGHLTWSKCPRYRVKGWTSVQSVFHKIRVSRADSNKLFDCIKLKELQPEKLWILHIPMRVGKQLESHGFVVGDRLQMHAWLDALMSLAASWQLSIGPLVKNTVLKPMFSLKETRICFCEHQESPSENEFLVNSLYPKKVDNDVLQKNATINMSSDSGINE